MTRFMWNLGLILLVCGQARAQDSIIVGQVFQDPPTYHCLGVSLPITRGDDNHNARVSVFYRKVGGPWKAGLPLLRVRPETVPFGFGSSIPEQFAGSLFDLDPGTQYEVKLAVEDLDGVNVPEILATLQTRPFPKDNPLLPRTVNVSSMEELRAALANAKPGDVIALANGTYNGSIAIARSGTKDNPIFVRGQSQAGVVVNGQGAEHGIVIRSGSDLPVEFVTVENFTVKGSNWGIRILGAREVVIRRMAIAGVSSGINATTYVEEENKSYNNENLTISDNLLQGKEVTWPNFDQNFWNFEGIVLEGSGHVVCYNTLSGFGDSLGFEICYGGITPGSYCPKYPPPNRFAIRNRGVDFYGNEVLWGADDGIELDFAERNVRCFRNRFSNTSMGLSFQPIWGGPCYSFRNVIYNVANRPYKLNNDPSGFYVLHNTAIRPGTAMNQTSGMVSNFQFVNNVTIGSGTSYSDSEQQLAGRTLNMSTIVALGSGDYLQEFDYNGWFPDGEFRIRYSMNGANVTDLLKKPFAAFQRDQSLFEQHGVLLVAPIFETLNHHLPDLAPGPPLPPPSDLTPRAGSGAVDRGVLLPNINDGYKGTAPDLGALERGDPMPWYGVRPQGDPPADTTPPSPPAGLKIK